MFIEERGRTGMPFSMAAIYNYRLRDLRICNVSTKYKNLSNFFDNIFPDILANKKIATLQVRIFKSHKDNRVLKCHGKKAFPPVPASLTLEAAMCLTLFIFASTCLILPMKIMNTERRIQAALEGVGEDLSQYAYLKDMLERNHGGGPAKADDPAQGITKYLVSGMAQGYAETQVLPHIDTKTLQNMQMVHSQVLKDGETIDLVLDYEIRLPFPILGLLPLQRTSRCRRRAWIGKDGKNYEEGGDGKEHTDEIVYIGKNSTRYHRSRSCHYLANKMSGVSLEHVGTMRNHNGGKYYPCSVCGKNAGGTVYITANGKSYHATQNCSAIVAYARAVRLSEVEHLGACSYCGK